jgi:hypothetical protein
LIGAGWNSPPAIFCKESDAVARHEHLPIYKKSMDLTIYFEKIVRNFSRYHKYTLGSELRAKSREIVGLIIKANSTAERLAILFELRGRSRIGSVLYLH